MEIVCDEKVYTCFCVEVIHEGHLNIINEAAKLGGHSGRSM